MKIAGIDVFQLDVPIDPFPISGGRVVVALDETIVRIVTDTGIEGWGDSVPWGSNYLPAFAHGVRAGLEELAPKLIGHDPRDVGAIYALMDREMTGQPAVKTALDVACWDILGKALDTPLWRLLGGMLTPDPKIVGGVPAQAVNTTLADLRGHGITEFSVKATGDVAVDTDLLRRIGDRMNPGETLKIDGNRGWRVDEAVRIARSACDIALWFEQPCATYEECRAVRQTTGVPLILDESVIDLPDLLRAREDRVLDGLNLKLGRVGGLTPMRMMRDVCVSLTVPMEIQDTGWSELACAVIAHVAHSTPERCIRAVMHPRGLHIPTLDTPAQVARGRMVAPQGAGIGAALLTDVLGDPIATYG